MRHLMRPKLAAFAAIVLLCCSTSFVSLSARADCSGAPALPAGCSWIPGSIVVVVPGTSCGITVNFCLACCNGAPYVYMYEIIPSSPGPGCNFVSPADMIAAGAAAVRDYAVGQCGAPPCNKPATIVKTFIPTCWTESGIAGMYEILPCSDPGCYCERDCDVCLDPFGNAIYSNCTTTIHGTCTCTALPNDPWWLLGTCYTIPCI
jgi:hypothetical protein